MKIRCPHCSKLSSVAAEKIPYRGVKAKCPHCDSKIFIGREFQVKLIEPSTATNKLPRQTDGQGEKENPLDTLSRMPLSGSDSLTGESISSVAAQSTPGLSRREQRPEEDIDWEPPVAIYESRVEGHWRKIFVIIAAVVALAALIASLAYDPPPENLEPLSHYSKTFERDIGQIKSRLAQRFSLSASHQLYVVSTGSSEVRLIEELYAKCRPTGRLPIETATILPVGSDAFEAEITCKGGEQHKLRYQWVLNTISVDGAFCK